MLFSQMLHARLQPSIHNTHAWLSRKVTLFIMVGILLSSIFLFNNLRPFSSVPAPISSSLMLIFARDSISTQPQIDSISGHDGSLHWKRTLDLSFPLSVVQGEITYVTGYDEKSQANRILALHTSDGSLLWNTPLQINASNKVHIPTPPIIADGNLYLNVLISGQGQVLTVRASDGKQLWSVSLSNYSDSDMDQPLAAGSGLLFVGSTNGMLHAYHSSNGTVAWNDKVSTDGYNRILPVFSNETIFTLSPLTNEVVAVHARDGQVQWRLLQQANLSLSSLAVKGTHLYVSGSLAKSLGDYMYTFDLHSRQLLWQQKVPNPGVSIEEAGGVAYVTSAEGFYALHADTGTLIWQKQEQDSVFYGQPVVVNGVIFVKTYRSRCPSIFGFGCSTPLQTMDAFRASDGFHYWEYATDFADRNTHIPPGIANDSNH